MGTTWEGCVCVMSVIDVVGKERFRSLLERCRSVVVTLQPRVIEVVTLAVMMMIRIMSESRGTAQVCSTCHKEIHHQYIELEQRRCDGLRDGDHHL